MVFKVDLIICIKVKSNVIQSENMKNIYNKSFWSELWFFERPKSSGPLGAYIFLLYCFNSTVSTLLQHTPARYVYISIEQFIITYSFICFSSIRRCVERGGGGANEKKGSNNNVHNNTHIHVYWYFVCANAEVCKLRKQHILWGN